MKSSIIKIWHVFAFVVLLLKDVQCQKKKPHIIVIIADDLGWNDVGFHGSNQIPTPHIDALAYNGAILNRHYTLPTCSPSRASFFTGKYAIRTGLQGEPIGNQSPIGLPLNETIMPQYLQKLGYVTKLVGKWHMGFFKKEYTPNERGFDSFFGYYGGWVRYNDSVLNWARRKDWISGIDARRNFLPAGDEFRNKYNMDVYVEEVENILKNHNSSKPLFMDVSFPGVHAILPNHLQVKNFAENEKRFSYIEDPNRRLFAGVLTSLDDAVGRIVKALENYKMLRDSIVLFITDNGGETVAHPFFQNFASNWPLRGIKGEFFEGAVRGVATIWSPFTQHRVVTSSLMHLSDWVPTFYKAAGGEGLNGIDGVNQWDFLSGKLSTPPRTQLLVNIDEFKNNSAFIDGDWKFVIQKNFTSKYYGVSGRESVYKYDMNAVLRSTTHQILSKYDSKPASKDDFQKIRNEAKIDRSCLLRLNQSEADINQHPLQCQRTGCLFNLKNDACEFQDVSSKNIDIVEKMIKILNTWRTQIVKQQRNKVDSRSNPNNFDGYWSPWL